MPDGNEWNRPLSAEEMAQASANDQQGDGQANWTAEDVRQHWEAAKQERGDLAQQYATQRGLDLDLIGPDEMRTGKHRSSPGAAEYPALLFPGTDDVGVVQRVQAIRFWQPPLLEIPPLAVRLERAAKITNGKGSAPLRLSRLPDCDDHRLLICEGPEDALTLRQVTGCETWAAFSKSLLGRMLVPVGRPVILCCDRGAEDDTREAAQRLADHGATVFLAPAPEGHKDANEALCEGNQQLILDALDKAEPISSDYSNLPGGFSMGCSGWIMADPPLGSDKPQVRVCRGLKVQALARDATGKGWGSLAEIETPDGHQHRWVIPHGSLAGDGIEVIRELRRLGLEVNRAAKNQLLALLDRWRPDTRARTVQLLGWTSDTLHSFVLGDGRVIGEDAVEPVVLDHVNNIDLTYAMRPQGDLADWQNGVASLVQGNPVLVFSICTALAGPLLLPLRIEGGGVHLVGTSSRGKSTALRIAASVWGGPELVSTWRATSNGLEGRAGAANGTCLILDELGEVEPIEAGQTAYMLGNGQGKQRSNRMGEAREVKRWRLLFLSSGEIGLADKLAEDRGRRTKAGQAVRLLDIPATGQAFGVFDALHEHDTAAGFSDALTRAAADSYGCAGPAFVQLLLGDLERAIDDARQRIECINADLLADHSDADGQVQRAAQRFGLIAATGEMAISWQLLPWDAGTAQDSAREMFRLWLGQRGGTQAAERSDAISRVRAFLSAHGASRFQKLNKSDHHGWEVQTDQTVRDRAGWYQPPDGSDPGIFWISVDAWRSEVLTGADPKRAARYLRDAGLLLSDGDNRAKRSTPRCIPAKRAYAISASILSADDMGQADD